ncbi:hypothetical protein COHA_007362 [Chlorella ohadii]|uniref:cGMP-dependent protein kinase n=1 Tax=Chlorella ohadii TaxID=2649997 RepID=A0AAD5DMG7_9CHLO|nr:hypothetical protein COHA_007362 [Chlorella ohadii]
MRKRIAVAAEAISSAADIEIPVIPKTDYAERLIAKAIEGCLLFEQLSLPAKQASGRPPAAAVLAARAIIRSMKPKMVKAGEVVIKQGDTDASTFYVLERGSADVRIHKEEWGEECKVHTYQPSSSFGELALLYSAPRAATVVAAADSKLWVMERAVYTAIKRTDQQNIAAERRRLVERVPLLAVLAPEHKAVVAEGLEMVEFQAGQAIFEQGEAGDKFYIIREGTVILTKDGAELARLSDEAYFGERALINAEPRAAAATADGYVVCYALGRKAFNELLGPIEDVWRYETLRKVPILSNLSEQQLFQLAGCMSNREFAAGQDVFRKGEEGDTFYIVEEGFFRAATVRATTPAKVLCCTRADFDRHLGSLGEIRNMWRFEALRKVPLLAPLTSQQRLALCTAFTAVSIRAGEGVIKKGEDGDTFYIIEEGACVVVADDGKELARLGPTAYFGERALLKNEPRAATVQAATDVRLLALGRDDFTRLLGPLQSLLESQAVAYDTPTTKISKALKLEDLKHVACLGAGAFGKVTLVQYDGKYYALKALSKAHVVQTGLQEHIKREKAVMSEFDSPFLVNLDSHSLYMVMELVQGGEFFTYLQMRESPLSEDEARFYAGCVVLGLEYMHDRGIAWRDLKPENLLLDTQGYLKITDFGFAKKIPQNGKTYTLCGTPEYLAPELVTQSGHSRAVDWWAVGVLIYEMVAGYPPFYQEDRVAMFRAICSTDFKYPAHFSKELRDLVKRLLVRSTARRLGCTSGGATEVKQHPWFKGFDWDALTQRKLKAPYVPKVSGPADASNFDAAQNTNSATRNSRYISTGVFKDF